MYGTPDGPVGDMMRRDLLLTRVHAVLREELREKVARNPGMTCQEVYDHLKKHFAVDDPHYWRKKWGEVKLRTQGEHVELAELLLFRAKFETALSRVADWTETEAIDMLMKNLPAYWVQEVMKQEAKRSKHGAMLKWQGALALSHHQVKAIVEQALGPVGQVTAMKGAFLLEVSRPQAERAAQMANLKVGGEMVSLEVVRKRMAPAEIFEYLQEELRTREESQVLMGGLDKGKTRQAQAVSTSSKEDNPLKEGSAEAPPKVPFEPRAKGSQDKGGKNGGKNGKGKGGKGKGKGRDKGWHGKGGRGPPGQDQY